MVFYHSNPYIGTKLFLRREEVANFYFIFSKKMKKAESRGVNGMCMNTFITVLIGG